MSSLHERARAAVEGATPGPWRSDWANDHTENEQAIVVTENPVNDSALSRLVVGLVYYDGLNAACREEDAQFIAAARTLVPDLADALAEAENRLAVAREALEFCHQESKSARTRLERYVGGDDIVVERAYGDIDGVFCAARDALAELDAEAPERVKP